MMARQSIIEALTNFKLLAWNAIWSQQLPVQAAKVLYNASLIDTNSKKKMGINGRFMYPKGSFIDPEIMLDCPKQIALSSAVDAFVHCIEGFIYVKIPIQYQIFLLLKASN